MLTSVASCGAELYWKVTGGTTDDDDEVEGAAESGYATGGAPSNAPSAFEEWKQTHPASLSTTSEEQRAAYDAYRAKQGGATQSPAPANAPTNAPTSYQASPNHRSGGNAWGGSPNGKSRPINSKPAAEELKYYEKSNLEKSELEKLATKTPKVEPRKIAMLTKSEIDPLHDESGDDFTNLDPK